MYATIAPLRLLCQKVIVVLRCNCWVGCLVTSLIQKFAEPLLFSTDGTHYRKLQLIKIQNCGVKSKVIHLHHNTINEKEPMNLKESNWWVWSMGKVWGTREKKMMCVYLCVCMLYSENMYLIKAYRCQEIYQLSWIL